jgi:hypothetical protein
MVNEALPPLLQTLFIEFWCLTGPCDADALRRSPQAWTHETEADNSSEFGMSLVQHPYEKQGGKIGQGPFVR